jgi:formylglycine-generating enzyme required for sulfatase activity
MGSASYALTLTVPDDPVYTNPGQTSTHKGVFVEGRRVPLDSFFMARYETTRQLWYEVQSWAEDQGYTFQNRISAPGENNRDKPVTNITWRDAVVWCNAYSEKSGLDPLYFLGDAVLRDSRESAGSINGIRMDKAKNGYRLPTEAEREFAARGGNPGRADWMYRYAGSNDPDEAAWHYGNAQRALQDAGGKSPNGLGIFDLSGNAQEWGWDFMHYAKDPAADTPPEGASPGSEYPQKPMSGGGVGSNVTMSCPAYRWGFIASYRDAYVGFRVLRRAE